jgi:tetratricopeptide (TPR) repeat protein
MPTVVCGHSDLLSRALEVGERCENAKVVGYACTFLTWACGDLGRFQEAAAYGEKAQEIAKLFPSDQYLYFKSLAGLGFLRWTEANYQKGRKIGELLLAYGEENANSRSKVIGHFINSYGEFQLGDFAASLASGMKSIEASEDPAYLQFGRLGVGWASLLAGDFAAVESSLKPVVDFCEKGGCGVFLPWACIFLGPALIGQGRMDEGMKVLEKAEKAILEQGRRSCEASYEYVLGKVFTLIAMGSQRSFAVMRRNIRFLARNLPFASRKAIEHFRRAIKISEEIGANSLLSSAYLDLGLFHKGRGEVNEAQESLRAAIVLLEDAALSHRLNEGREALATLEGLPSSR